jgi:hypothetical protein
LIFSLIMIIKIMIFHDSNDDIIQYYEKNRE